MGCGQFLNKNSNVLEPKAKQQKPNNEDPAPIEKKESVKKEEDSKKEQTINSQDHTNASMNPNTVQKPKSFQERIAQTPWIHENFTIDNIESLGEGTYGKVFGTVHIKKQNEGVT